MTRYTTKNFKNIKGQDGQSFKVGDIIDVAIYEDKMWVANYHHIDHKTAKRYFPYVDQYGTEHIAETVLQIHE